MKREPILTYNEVADILAEALLLSSRQMEADFRDVFTSFYGKHGQDGLFFVNDAVLARANNRIRTWFNAAFPFGVFIYVGPIHNWALEWEE